MPIYALSGKRAFTTGPATSPKPFLAQTFKSDDDAEAQKEVQRRRHQHPGLVLFDLVLKRLGVEGNDTLIPL